MGKLKLMEMGQDFSPENWVRWSKMSEADEQIFLDIKHNFNTEFQRLKLLNERVNSPYIQNGVRHSHLLEQDFEQEADALVEERRRLAMLHLTKKERWKLSPEAIRMKEKKTNKKQFLTGDQARPASRQHKVPCEDCPFARTAIRGWLGALGVDEWLRAAHGEALVDCHTISNQQCAGTAIYRANVAKLCYTPGILRLEPNRKLVFASPMEFRAHHDREEKG